MPSGATHLFIPGPTNLPERVRQAMAVPMRDMRAPDFGDLTLPIFEDLKKVFQTRTGRVFVFPSSGSGAWEAGITNTLNPGDRVLMASHGQFSMLWAQMAERLGLNVDLIELPWGEAAPLAEFERRLEADRAGEIKAVFVTQNETATGVTSDVPGVRAALTAADHNALLFVDGVSSIGSIDFQMEAWGVDLAVAGSQKGFMCPTGLGLLGVSAKAMDAASRSTMRRAYFEFADMVAMNKDGYFPYTPATQLLQGLRAAMDMLFEEGLEAVFARHHRLAEGIRRGVHGLDLELAAMRPEIASDTVTAIRTPDGVDAREVLRVAYFDYNTSFGSGLGPLAGKVFRIGHLGDLNEVMCMSALAAAEISLLHAGAKVELGAGVAAAQQYFAESKATALKVAAE